MHAHLKYKLSADDIYDYSVNAETYIAFWDPLMNLSMYAAIIFISWFGAKAIIASGNNPDLGLTTGKLMSLVTYGMQLLMSLMFMSMIYVMLVISSASIERVKEVLMEEPSIKNGDNPVYKVNDGFDTKKDTYEEYGIGNLKDITPSFLYTANILLSMLKEYGINHIEVPSFLVERWNAKELYISYKEAKLKDVPDKIELITELRNEHERIQSELFRKAVEEFRNRNKDPKDIKEEMPQVDKSVKSITTNISENNNNNIIINPKNFLLEIGGSDLLNLNNLSLFANNGNDMDEDIENDPNLISTQA